MAKLTVDGVRLRIGDRTLLDDLRFEAAPGELIAIVGPNGIGKSTLLRAIAGAFAPSAGTIALGGARPHDLPARVRARSVALVGSDVETPGATSVREIVATARFAYHPWWDWTRDDADAAAVVAALERVGMLDLIDRPFDTLSSGERQRVLLALALAQDASTVLLDEPTSHLDPRHALETICLIRGLASGERNVVVVLHDLGEAAAIADRIAVLGDGRLLACDVPGRALDPVVLERAYGIPFERFDSGDVVRVAPRRARAATER